MTYKHLLIVICTVFCFFPVFHNIEIDGRRTTPNIHEIATNLSIVSNILENLLQTYEAIVIKTGDRVYAEHKIKDNFTIVSNVLESLKKRRYLYEQEFDIKSAEIARRAGEGGPRAFKGTTMSLSQELRALEKGDLDEVNENCSKPQAFKKTMSLSEELEVLLKRHLTKKKDKPQAFHGTAMYLSEELEALVKRYSDLKKEKFTKPRAFKDTSKYLSEKLEESVKRHLDKKKDKFTKPQDKFTKPQAFKENSKYLSEELEVLERRHLDEIEVKFTKPQAFRDAKINLSDKLKAEETSNVDAMININNKKHEAAIINNSEENLTAELIIDWGANDCNKSSIENLCESKKHGGKQSSSSSRESTINFKSKKTNMKAEEENDSVEDQSMEKIIKHAVYLRDSYTDVCLQVVIRQCFRALRSVLKTVCSRGKSCKSEFKDNFRANGQDGCTKQFNNKTAVCRTGLNYFDNEAERYSEDVEDLKERKTHNHTSAKTPEVNVLRDRFEKLCQKSKLKKCQAACNEATNKTCGSSNCVTEKKRALKRSCTRFCKIHMKYKGSTSDSDDDVSNDDSGSDDDDDDDDSDK